ncbi:phosphatase PAP2 family protein [Synechocystis sp. LEGE 06083]|uniref:phosphatase PAP2 family protein n=1 Tax=Synechocystis sp. LEGE 06083 TaxID=915336 RepID=UPI0018829943|nr:phosphatase PAP2 family protein [Synechocystis sp. LEGE 06083]MBE9193967.1 phosphatase PAP2 family protein [Synechocystis sp. LEGE 06083]
MASLSNYLVEFWVRRVYPRIAPLIALVGATGLGLSLVIIFLLAKLSDNVWEQEAFTFDKTILLWIHKFANPTLDQVMLGITHLGNPSTVIPFAILIFALLWWRCPRQQALVFALACLGGAILSFSLKLTFSKPRPQLWSQLILEKTFSYPSGHALGSMVLYGFSAYLLAINFPKKANIIYALASFLIVAIGFSRLYLGVHWPTDIIAGYGVGFLWIIVCATLSKLVKATKSMF